jgi:signal transduction histidine kinase
MVGVHRGARGNRMPGGGIVITFSDVTPSFEAAEALERANATLEKRVRERTEELTRLNSELALAKQHRRGSQHLQDALPGGGEPRHPAAAQRRPALRHQPRRAAGAEATMRRLVDNIDDSLEAIEEILGALLDISRLDAGAMTPDRSPASA